MLPYAKIAKAALTQIVALNVASAAETALETYTEIDTDTITVTVATTVVGQIVGLKLKPYTDRIIDVPAAKLKARKDRKNNIIEADAVDITPES